MPAAKPGLIRNRRHGASPILIARYHGKQEVVEYLRESRPALDIFEAAALGDRETAERLLDADGSLANAVAEDGFGPLGLASFFDHESVVRLLLQRNARVDVASSNEMHVMPLHSAAAARSVPIARLLLERGAPVNARQGTGGMGFTPLMEAALNGQAEMVDLLLEYGADRTMRDEKGHTAGDCARQNGHVTLADHLGWPGMLRQHPTPSPYPLPHWGRGIRSKHQHRFCVEAALLFIPLPIGREGRSSSRDARLGRRGEG